MGKNRAGRSLYVCEFRVSALFNVLGRRATIRKAQGEGKKGWADVKKGCEDL